MCRLAITPGPPVHSNVQRGIALTAGRRSKMMMDSMGMGWMMGGMALVWILVVIVLVLAIAALVKFLRR